MRKLALATPSATAKNAVVSIYSDAEYVSYDLGFIPTGLARKASVLDAPSMTMV